MSQWGCRESRPRIPSMEAEDCLSVPGLGVNVGDFCTPAWLSAESQGNLERPTPRFVMTLDVAPVQSRWSSTKDPAAQLGCCGHNLREPRMSVPGPGAGWTRPRGVKAACRSKRTSFPPIRGQRSRERLPHYHSLSGCL